MNRRTIPFGYKFENGAVVVEDSAADIVKEIDNIGWLEPFCNRLAVGVIN